jgi:molybdate transport system ATP-binding protein
VSTLSAEIRLRLSPAFQLNCQLEISSGFTVLFGPSGAGKTSLLDCISGIKRPDEGRISVDAKLLFDSRTRIDVPVSERQLAYLFQTLALFPHLTVRRNIEYGLYNKAAQDRQQRCLSIARRFGLEQLIDRLPGDLSGGECQRVALARSLVTSPRALLLDEPLVAIDRRTRREIVADLRRWSADHEVPILYVTHSAREALELGEQLLLMQDGRIVARGVPTDLLNPEDWD